MTAWKPGEPVRIETERTWIRTMTPSDVTDRVVGWFADPKVMEFIGWRMNTS